MPITWKIKKSTLYIVVTGHGAYSLEETIRNIRASQLYSPSMSLVLDRSGALDTPSSEELRDRARFIKMLLTPNSSRCAIVIGPKPHDYNFGRTLGSLLHSEGIGTEVFTSVAEGERWLVSGAATA